IVHRATGRLVMRTGLLLSAALSLILMTGCDDNSPRDVTPPAAPRGVYSVTGDGSATLHWLAHTEADLSGCRVYDGDSGAPGAPYYRVGTTTLTSFQVVGLANGVTKFFAVSAVDRSGNESALSYDNVQDTPRPAGTGLILAERIVSPSTNGYDFSAYLVPPRNDGSTDIYFQVTSGVPQMICPFSDTDIQDAGYATTLDAVDFAPPPTAGWSADGTVELIPGHCYVVRIGTGPWNVAKFRVT